jgi:hypothetical protein
MWWSFIFPLTPVVVSVAHESSGIAGRTRRIVGDE